MKEPKRSRSPKQRDNNVFDESNSLSDIEDAEINKYIYNEKEKPLVKTIWEALNREYLEKLASKNANGGSLNAVTTTKERKRRRTSENKSSNVANFPTKTLKQDIAGKEGLSAKINLDALEKLLSTGEGQKEQILNAGERDNGGEAEGSKAICSGVKDDGFGEKYGEGVDDGDYWDYQNGGGDDYEYEDERYD